ncbi:ABC transporter ATP-binding protein [Mycoplasmopsis gallopavonis]|uniref:Alkylphosphonate ABC transporter, ATP-binding component n=1 Tax=Mycoplasmopsis gallopavonis TaxID=76629 RepID=A0A449AYY4_9BACT|nr:ABC transporter ATP-binding protein [Mycoplasmopsis gallopavonis]RIV16876.1 ABC transporter ATP-binding protein [Mycoplasmopsis gallopavonis]VEU72666.1 Alkylphosphonate ABC transporter, ATP-binding component [Mycoplasmopsis gallopavonis]
MIKFQQVQLQYNQKNLVLKNINLEFQNGQIIGLIGKSGCGKTTLLKSIFDHSLVVQGQIYVNDLDLQNRKNQKKINQKLTFIDQEGLYLEEYDFYHNLKFSYQNWSNFLFKTLKIFTKTELSTIWEELTFLGLENWAFVPLKNLSAGQKQRMNILRGLANDSQIILADEPTSNLDLNSSNKVMQLFVKQKQANKVVIIAIHDLEIALNYCDVLVAFKDQEVAGVFKPSEIKLNELKEYFDN